MQGRPFKDCQRTATGQLRAECRLQRPHSTGDTGLIAILMRKALLTLRYSIESLERPHPASKTTLAPE
jgi:hypothetical protein